MALHLTLRQRLTYTVHMFKALTKRHHKPIRPLLRRYIATDAVVFDVGANTGSFTHLFSKMAPAGHIYAFEPGSYALSILRRVIAQRCQSNVTLLEHGLSDKNENLELHLPVKKSGSLGHGIGHIGTDSNDPRATVSETIPLRRMDDIAETLALTRLDFIKIDVEGWEMHVLRGGEKTIARFKPIIMLEMVEHFLRRAGSNCDELLGFLHQHGYKTMHLCAKTGGVSTMPENLKAGEILALPPGHDADIN